MSAWTRICVHALGSRSTGEGGLSLWPGVGGLGAGRPAFSCPLPVSYSLGPLLLWSRDLASDQISQKLCCSLLFGLIDAP
jgi:hypothetical protein